MNPNCESTLELNKTTSQTVDGEILTIDQIVAMGYELKLERTATITEKEFLSCVQKARKWAKITGKNWVEYPGDKCGYLTWKFGKLPESDAIDEVYLEYLTFMTHREKATESYVPNEDEIGQDIREFTENWRIFMKLLVRQPFFHDLKITEDNVISEPKNWPCMYNVMEVCQLAEVCGLLALVTVENGKVVIKIS